MANNESIRDFYQLGEKVIVAKKEHVEEIQSVVTVVDETIQQHAEEAEQRLVDIETGIKSVDDELDDHHEESNTRFTTIENSITELETEMVNVKKSVSDGKKLVADAITAKGISTAIDAEYAVMATNIANITTIEAASADMTATAGDILSGKTGIVKGAVVTGSMANNGAISQSLGINGTYTIPAGYHNGEGKVTQSLTTQGAQTITPGTADKTIAANRYLTGVQTIKGDANLVSANIKSGVSIFGVSGNSNVVDTSAGDATAAQILSGKKAYVDGKLVTGSIASQGAQTITPGTANKTIASGKYLSGTQTIKGDANLVAGNIKKGVSIFGVSGTYEPSGMKSITKTFTSTLFSYQGTYQTMYSYRYPSSLNTTITLDSALKLLVISSTELSYTNEAGTTYNNASRFGLYYTDKNLFVKRGNYDETKFNVSSTSTLYFYSINQGTVEYGTSGGFNEVSTEYYLSVSSDRKTMTFKGYDSAYGVRSTTQISSAPTITMNFFY